MESGIGAGETEEAAQHHTGCGNHDDRQRNLPHN
jgi:hypothetical protein